MKVVPQDDPILSALTRQLNTLWEAITDDEEEEADIEDLGEWGEDDENTVYVDERSLELNAVGWTMDQGTSYSAGWVVFVS